MRPGTVLRTFAICSALVASISLAACSSDDDNGSTGQAGGDGGSTEEYCTAVKELDEIVQQAGGREVSDDVVRQLVDLLSEANSAAPPAVRRDFSAAFLGDPGAQESVARFNEQECGVNGDAASTTSP